MNKEEAKQILGCGGRLSWESWYWSNFVFQCDLNEEDYICCYESFSTVEDILEHLEDTCGGKWEEVKTYETYF